MTATSLPTEPCLYVAEYLADSPTAVPYTKIGITYPDTARRKTLDAEALTRGCKPGRWWMTDGPIADDHRTTLDIERAVAEECWKLWKGEGVEYFPRAPFPAVLEIAQKVLADPAKYRPWPKGAREDLTLVEIAMLFDVNIQTVKRWHQKGDLGTPLSGEYGVPALRNGRPPTRYRADDVRAFGMATGRMDSEGNILAKGQGKTGYYALPTDPTTDARGRRMYYTNHVARAFGVEEGTAKTWRARGVMPKEDATVQGKPVWFEQTLLKWGADTKRTFTVL